MSEFINKPSKEELTKPPKRKKRWAIILAVLGVCSSIIGCGDADSYIETSTGNTIQETDASLIQTATETTENTTVFEDCPEGYVYDYQVSMEPIPEEIAALGGPCQGTIHAYPSRIAMALTELQMEEDPVLKAEVEKRIPEIEAALEEEIGGDFVVDGVILRDDLSWVFICTEVATGYQFDLGYVNYEYNGYATQNDTWFDDYYEEKESIIFREELLPIIREVYGNSDCIVKFQSDFNVVDIIIANYSKEEIDKCIEQEKLLMFWEKLQEYDETLLYHINLSFFSPEYKGIIQEKLASDIRSDFSVLYSEKQIMKLVEQGDIWANFYYADFMEQDEIDNLDILLQQYHTGTYDNTVVWDYWIE